MSCIGPARHVQWKLLLWEPTYQLPCVTTTTTTNNNKKTCQVRYYISKKYLKKEQFESALTLDHYVTIVVRAKWHWQVYHSPNLRRWTWAPAAWRGNLDKHISAVIVCLRLAIHPNYTHVAHGFQRVPIRCTNQSFKKNPMHLSVLHFYLGIRRLQIESVVFISRKNRREYLPQ